MSAIRRSRVASRRDGYLPLGCLEALEGRQLFAGPVTITIGAGETYELTGDVTDFTSLTIQGAGPDAVLDGKGFQIVNDSLSGNVSISNVRLKNLGKPWVNPTTGVPTPSPKNHAISLTAPFTGQVTIRDTVFD